GQATAGALRRGRRAQEGGRPGRVGGPGPGCSRRRRQGHARRDRRGAARPPDERPVVTGHVLRARQELRPRQEDRGQVEPM
ncbi:MAG: hypothetical protein AVDCRST_MAG53-2688, partial [uncultured Solirubrobacteraceae bacterium]